MAIDTKELKARLDALEAKAKKPEPLARAPTREEKSLQERINEAVAEAAKDLREKFTLPWEQEARERALLDAIKPGMSPATEAEAAKAIADTLAEIQRVNNLPPKT